MTEAKLECGCIVERGRLIRGCKQQKCEYSNYLHTWREYEKKGNVIGSVC